MHIKTHALIWALLLSITLQQGHATDSIGSDDLLRISVYGYDDLKLETRVSTEGIIAFPLIGEILVKGKSSRELEETIASRLIQGGFIHTAQVNVTILDHVSQQVSVLGYVNKPGRYPLNSDSSIVDLIAMAGGIQEAGDLKLSVARTVDHQNQKFELNLEEFLENNAPFKIQRGDIVYVPKAPVFYIYGEVQHPGCYRLERNTSVIKALSIGGGLTLRGTQNDIAIQRKDDRDVLQKIDAELSDVVFKDDVIYVGERWF